MDLTPFHGLDIVLVCGLPGSGKSHFAAQHFAGTERKRVNRKEIRRLLFEMSNFGKKWTEAEFAASDEFLVKHVERKIVEHLLEGRQKILIDNTNISVEARKPFVAIAHRAGRSIGAVFLDTPVIRCIERNRSRADLLPERVISQLAAEKQLPLAEEGFREVLTVSSY